MDAEFVDPPLNRPVTTEEVARKVREIDDISPGRSERSKWLDHPISLKELMPERPYWSDSSFVRKMEAYNRALDAVQPRLAEYDSIVIVGGSGPMLDLVNNQRVHDLILSFYRAGKPIAAECYGVACLAFARSTEDRKSIIWGKHVTGHCLEYDYQAGTGFEGPHAVDGSTKGFGDGYIDFGPPFYTLEYILRDATGPDGAYHRQLRPRDLGHRGLPVHHRAFDARFLPHGAEAGRGAGARPEARTAGDGTRRVLAIGHLIKTGSLRWP